jgi:peptidase E
VVLAHGTLLTLGGGGFSMSEDGTSRIDDFLLSLAEKDRPRVCFVPTASGDAADYIERFEAAFDGRAVTSVLSLFGRDGDELRSPLLNRPSMVLEQDVVYVGGGSTANLLAVWRAQGFDRVVRQAWQAGAVLAGSSAGAICWFQACVTDSFRAELDGLNDGLGFLAGSCCPHYDGEERRRPVYRELVAAGFPAGYAIDDGAAVLFEEREFVEVASARPGATAYRVALQDGHVVEDPLPARAL